MFAPTMTKITRVAPLYFPRPAVAATTAATRHRPGKSCHAIAAAGIAVAPVSAWCPRVSIDDMERTGQSPSRGRISEEKPVMKSPAGCAGVAIGLSRFLPVFALGLWFFSIEPATADKPHQAEAGKSRHNCAEPASVGAPQGSAGLRAFVDPQTGKLAAPPAGGRPDDLPVPQADLSTSDEGLVEVPLPAPGRGVMVRLQGRFRSSLTATVDPDGKTRIRHETPCADGAGSKR